ncbi:MerR family transcriptional regulator [Acetonema longum]|uniref:MerR family transcriptional regulator n=1 Tax=Acetonema longum DSM 6540 TaxID=1009370 RepID=F7NKP7_9FIRM|nr:MerR family transcriptional regulator [Acetonema longum]EGO63351.1 MerR family transcriptional regulator [Acetonema longum DSM 6540]
MKDNYTISEISKLYGIGVDSLRYYEKIGVLTPRRGRNGYRLYILKDIYKLNIIRDLRQLGFSMAQIKEYLDRQSIGNTMTLLRDEELLIQKQLKTLNASLQSIRKRMVYLESLSHTPAGVFTVKSFPERFCLQLNADITRDEEMDFAFKKLHRKYEDKMHLFGNQPLGAFQSMEDLTQGRSGLFRSVFFILEQKMKDCDFVFPAGQYLSLFYRGDYRQSAERIRDVLSHAKENNYTILGNPFELYRIDNHETMLTAEFLTEIQVQIETG